MTDRDLDFLRLEERAFETCPSISIDYAVMEKTDRAVVVTAPFDWNDVGSWSALWTMGDKDQSGNVAVGDVVLEDTSGCYVRGEGPLVAALGVENLVITATPDVVLVTTRDRDQDVGKLVARLKTAHASYPSLRFSLTLATLANNAGASSAQSLGSGAQDSFNVYGDESLAAVQSTFGFSGASTWLGCLTNAN